MKNKKKKVNPFKAYFGAMLSSIGSTSPMDLYYQGNPDHIPTRPLEPVTVNTSLGIPDPNHVPTRELKPANVNTELKPIGEKGDPYKAFPKAPDTVKPLPTAKEKKAGMDIDPSINVKTITGSILPAINSMITDRYKRRTAPLMPLEVYNPYSQGTGSQAIMNEGGKLKPKPKAGYKVDPNRDQINLHDLLTYTLANGNLPKDPNMRSLMKGNQQLVTDAQVWSQRTDQQRLSPEERINSYFDRPVNNNPLDLQRAQLKSIGYGPTSTWRNSPTLDLQQQSGAAPDMELVQHRSGGKLSSSKAKEMLKDGTANGKKLTKKQKRYFGMVASGKAKDGLVLDDAFWGAIIGAVGGQAAGQGGQKLGAAMKENVKNAAQAPQEIMNFLSQITAASRYTPDGMLESPNIAPEQMRYEDGGSLRGDGLDILWGGNAEQISDNPYDGGTIQFNGASHEKDGIGIQYGGKSVEVEGAETAVKDSEGNLNIMGNMNVPGTGIKFKNMSKKISKKEDEYDKIKTTGAILVNTYEPYDKWNKLKFNSGKVMMEGGDLGQQDLVRKKRDLAALQSSILETAEEYNINPDALSKGEVRKARKGTFDKAESGAKLDPGPKFKLLKAAALTKLQSLYPNSKVEIKETGEERSIKQQRGLKSRGASKTSVSLHNLGGARDYLIYIDGKLVKDTGIYKQVIQAPAKELGLHTIGDWDAGHVGAVPEGKGTNPFSTFLREHPDMRDKPVVKETISFLDNLVKGKKADRQEISAYNQITGSKLPFTGAITPNYKEAEQFLPAEPGEWFNQNLVPPNQPLWSPGAPIPELKLPSVPLIYKEPQKPTPEVPVPPDNLTPVVPPEEEPLPSNAQPLGLSQILPEIHAFANNQVEPVPLQQFAPLLEQPYQVSFQDRLNNNTSTFRALERQVQDSPTALSALAAQQYGANQSVMADEFRFNQGEASRVYNANRQTLNQAQMTNMGLMDQQYVRQSKARSNTKAQTQEILNSLSGKVSQNRLNNQRLALYENLYNYRFKDTNKDGISAEAVNMNPDPSLNFDLLSNPTSTANSATRTRVEKDATGNVKKVTEMTPSELEKAIIKLRLEKEQRNKPLVTIPKLFNNLR